MSAITREDVPVAIQTEDAEVRIVEVGEMAAAFFTLKQGADFGPALAGLPDNMPVPRTGATSSADGSR